MKLNQLAFYCATNEQALSVKRKLGLQDAQWSHDTVTAEVTVWRVNDMEPWHGTNVAELQFNESWGMQLEIIRYVEGIHWCMYNPEFELEEIFLAHAGVHLDNASWPAHLADEEMVQQAFTKHHTAFIDRTYEYRIYRIAPTVFIKYIKRIPK